MFPIVQKTAVAVAHVKRGNGLIKLNGECINTVDAVTCVSRAEIGFERSTEASPNPLTGMAAIRLVSSAISRSLEARAAIWTARGLIVKEREENPEARCREIVFEFRVAA